MKRLHQTGNIAQEQLVLILRKLMEVYRMKGEKPEIMVSLSDFEFVVKLPRTKNKLEYEAELGQLIKTALLWLEDDLMQRYGRHLLEISPKNLLTEGYVQDKTGDVFAREFHSYLTKVEGEDGVYVARLEALWEERETLLMREIESVLSEEEQRIFYAYLDGDSYREIAASLSVSTKKVDNTLQKIRKSLKKSLNR